MSTTFNFPASPTVGDFFTLPNGSVTQWNGTEWVSVDNSNVQYPLAIAAGGTGATTAPQARINLGINSATGEFIVPDGTVALPGLAFASEPGLGWYRNGAGIIRMAGLGGSTVGFSFAAPAATYMALYPRAAGLSSLSVSNAPLGAADGNQFSFIQESTGTAHIVTGATGAAVRKNIFLDAPQIVFPDGAVAAPSVAFSQEPGLGMYRSAAGIIRWAGSGGDNMVLDSASATGMTLSIGTRALGSTTFSMGNNLIGSANRNLLQFTQYGDGTANIRTTAIGTATRGNMVIDAANVYLAGTVVQAQPATGGTDAWFSVQAQTAGSASLALNAVGSGKANALYGYKGNLRWGMLLGNSGAESGGNQGSDFVIYSCNDAGSWLGDRLAINRATGLCAHTVSGGSHNSLSINQSVSGATYAGLQFNHPSGGRTLRLSSTNVIEWVNWANTAAVTTMTDAGVWNTAGSFSPASDERIKHDIAPIERDTGAFMRIVPISFKRNLDPESGDHWGFSAQNLYANFPLAVVGSVTATKDDGEPDPAALDITAILAQTVLEVQSLINRITQLEQP